VDAGLAEFLEAVQKADIATVRRSLAENRGWRTPVMYGDTALHRAAMIGTSI